MSVWQDIRTAYRYRAVFSSAGLPSIPGPPPGGPSLWDHQEMPSQISWALPVKQCPPQGDHRYRAWWLVLRMLFFSKPLEESEQKSDIPHVMDWMFVSSPNSYVEALTPLNVMVFGGRTFGRWLSLDEVMRVVPPEWDQCPYKKKKRPELTLPPPHEYTVRRQRSASQEEGSHRNSAMPTPWSWTCSLQNCEK